MSTIATSSLSVPIDQRFLLNDVSWDTYVTVGKAFAALRVPEVWRYNGSRFESAASAPTTPFTFPNEVWRFRKSP